LSRRRREALDRKTEWSLAQAGAANLHGNRLAHWAEHLVQAYQVYALRLELHLLPRMIGMYYHLFPSAPEAARMHCTCSLRLHSVTT
jgi:hypothetical protein